MICEVAHMTFGMFVGIVNAINFRPVWDESSQKCMRHRSIYIVLLLLLLPLQAAARQPISAALYAGGETHSVDFQFSEPIDIDPEEDGDTFGLGITYAATERWHVSFDWTQSDADDVKISNATVGLDYHLPLGITNLYGVVGVFAGAGTLDWQNKPPNFDPLNDDLKSREASFGPHLGLRYDLSEHWSASLSYRYFVQEFNTNAEIGGELIEFQHDNIQTVLFGIRYHL